MKRYRVARAEDARVGDGWDEGAWTEAATADISEFRSESSSHRPCARVRLLHTHRRIEAFFHVEDRYVRCLHTRNQDPVCQDACVELFLQPEAGGPYFNFEVNCGGALLSMFIEDWRRGPEGFARAHPLRPALLGKVRARASLPGRVEPETAGPVTWWARLGVPLDALEPFAGPLGSLSGQVWRGNFYKCAENNSHPHWAAWSPVHELNFHLPSCFGEIAFA